MRCERSESMVDLIAGRVMSNSSATLSLCFGANLENSSKKAGAFVSSIKSGSMLSV